jgi:ABC-type sugar transport system permease subunit
MSRNKKRQNRLGYLFLTPWMIGFIVFTAFPIFYTIYLSFNQVTLTIRGWTYEFIGFENYFAALFRNVEFIPALIEFVTLEALYVPTVVIISFILAMLLNSDVKYRTGFRIIFFLPVIILSGSVMSQLMSSGNSQMTGIENVLVFQMIRSFSRPFANIVEMLFENFSLVLWFTGIPIVLYINGLQKISKNLYEAAQIDGATSWQILWKITIPIIRPTALIVAIFSIVQFGMFPLNPLYEMIQSAMMNTVDGLGIASSFAWMFSLWILFFILIAYVLLKDRNDNKKAFKEFKKREKERAKLLKYQKRQAKRYEKQRKKVQHATNR